MILYPVFGSAFPATSGTIRPSPAGGAGTFPTCHSGSGKTVEYPPPVPSPLASFSGLLFHTLSVPDCGLVVPPHPMTFGQDAGQSTLAGVVPPSDESLSPEAAQTRTPADR